MPSSYNDALARAARHATPPPRLDLAAWIEGNLVLPEGMTRQHGPVRLWPYQRGICDAISDPEVERITVVKSARLGYTTLLTGMIASYVANDPCQMLVVLPTDDDCRDYVVSELEPVFAATPGMKGRLADDSAGKSRNTITRWRFAGGSAKFISGQSPRNMRRHNARVLIIDEAAALAADSDAGSVVSRAITRTKGFDDRKIIMGSTPLDDTSNVLLSYGVSDRRRFEVPCPECGGFSFIAWRHIEWETGRPEKAAFRCPHCQGLIGERHKPAMVAAGQWIAQSPEVRDHAGFMINALVSPLPNASWGKLATEFLFAKDDPDLLRPFVNETLAEPWRGGAADVDEDDLRKTAEPIGLNVRTDGGEARPIPSEVLAITTGTDVQDDRLEVSVVGWSATEAFVLAHRVIWGSPGDADTWREHDDLMQATWQHAHGGVLKVEAAIVDSGDGDWTQAVYDYCFPRARRRIMAGKGVGGNRPDWQPSQSTVKGGRLFIVGVDGLKTSIMDRLERGRLIRFSDTLEPSYFDQLLSERRVLKRVRGQPRRAWDRKPGARAETLDCLVYAFAARRSLTNIDFDHRRAAMAGQGSIVTPQPRSVAEQRAAEMAGPIRRTAGGRLIGRSPHEQLLLDKYGEAAITGNTVAPPRPAPTPAPAPVANTVPAPTRRLLDDARNPVRAAQPTPSPAVPAVATDAGRTERPKPKTWADLLRK